MASDVMRGKDRLQEISMKLEQSHLVYLQTDDSPLKLQQRHKLEGTTNHLMQYQPFLYNNLDIIVNFRLYKGIPLSSTERK